MSAHGVLAATLVKPGEYELREYPLPDPAPGCEVGRPGRSPAKPRIEHQLVITGRVRFRVVIVGGHQQNVDTPSAQRFGPNARKRTHPRRKPQHPKRIHRANAVLMFERQRGLSARQVVIAAAFVGRNVSSVRRARPMSTLTGHRITRDRRPVTSPSTILSLLWRSRRPNRRKPIIHLGAEPTYFWDESNPSPDSE